MPDNRPNIQVRQPGIEGYDTADKNGWPDPLVSPLSPLKMAVTNGSNGTRKNFDPVTTSQQDLGQHHLPEGDFAGHVGNHLDQGPHTNKWATSQQNAGDHSIPESGDSI